MRQKFSRNFEIVHWDEWEFNRFFKTLKFSLFLRSLFSVKFTPAPVTNPIPLLIVWDVIWHIHNAMAKKHQIFLCSTYIDFLWGRVIEKFSSSRRQQLRKLLKTRDFITTSSELCKLLRYRVYYTYVYVCDYSRLLQNVQAFKNQILSDRT